MTMKPDVELNLGPQEKGFRNFHEKFDLNVTAPELEQQLEVQWEFVENPNSLHSELPGRMDKQEDHHCEEAQRHEEKVLHTMTTEGSVDHLLILAQSAEIVAQSEDSVARMHSSNQNKGSHNNLGNQMSPEYAGNVTGDGQECSQELDVNRCSEDSHVTKQRHGFCFDVTRPRLTQIRKQARCKYLILDKEKNEDIQCKHLKAKTIRMTQIKHQARCKSKNDLLPKEIITGLRNERPQGIMRLSQMKHQARSKGNSTAKEGTEEHMDGNMYCNKFKGTSVSVVEGAPAHRFFRGGSQSSIVRHDYEIIREQQHTARRLRASKTKKLRQQLKTQCLSNSVKKRVHAMKMSSIGYTSIINLQQLSHSATLLKDKDLIACQEKLPKMASSNEKLRVNFGAEKIQGHLGSNDSSGLICESHQHIPNGLPVQNYVVTTFFAQSPNHIFQQCDTNVKWMLYMHHMQLKEYHQVAARQHRAERIKEKRASKDKHQNNSKNSIRIKAANTTELSQAPLKKDKSFQHWANSLFHEAHSEAQKEYHQLVARQHRAECIKEKRASKYKHQTSKNLLQSKTENTAELYQAPLKMDKGFQHLANSLIHKENSEAQMEFMPGKSLRLTQLKREARLGNRCYVMQGAAEN